MREDNLIRFIIYSKTITRKSRGYESVILYSKIYSPSDKELEEKKIDRERIRKYTKKLLEDIPKLRLSTNGYLEITEEADVLDEINSLFIGMPNVVYKYKNVLSVTTIRTQRHHAVRHICVIGAGSILIMNASITDAIVLFALSVMKTFLKSKIV